MPGDRKWEVGDFCMTKDSDVLRVVYGVGQLVYSEHAADGTSRIGLWPGLLLPPTRTALGAHLGAEQKRYNDACARITEQRAKVQKAREALWDVADAAAAPEE